MSGAPESSIFYRVPMALALAITAGVLIFAPVIPQFIDDHLAALERDSTDVRTAVAREAFEQIVVDLNQCPRQGPGMLSTVSIVIDSPIDMPPRLVSCARFTDRGYLPKVTR